jgi:hypothetical protein
MIIAGLKPSLSFTACLAAQWPCFTPRLASRAQWKPDTPTAMANRYNICISRYAGTGTERLSRRA